MILFLKSLKLKKAGTKYCETDSYYFHEYMGLLYKVVL